MRVFVPGALKHYAFKSWAHGTEESIGHRTDGWVGDEDRAGVNDISKISPTLVAWRSGGLNAIGLAERAIFKSRAEPAYG